MEIKIRVPRIPAGAISNIVGLLGLLAVVIAIGGLTENLWWSVLSGGAVAFGLAVVAQLGAQTEQQEAAPSTVAAAAARPTVAKAS